MVYSPVALRRPTLSPTNWAYQNAPSLASVTPNGSVPGAGVGLSFPSGPMRPTVCGLAPGLL